MNYIIYAPKGTDDCEKVRQKYISWVKSSDAVSEKFKKDFDPRFVSVEKKWRQYRELDCEHIIVSTTGQKIQSSTYHVDAKITGNKVYTDGKYDYYRKEDFKPAHDETSYSLSRGSTKDVIFEKKKGDKCILTYGTKSYTSAYCEELSFNEVHPNDLSSVIRSYVSDSDLKSIEELDQGFDIYYDFNECLAPLVKSKYKQQHKYWGDELKFTIEPERITEVDIKTHTAIFYPVYEVSYNYKFKKYGGEITSSFCVPQYAPQSHDNPYKNYQKSIILSVVTVLSLVLAMILAPTLSHKGLMQMYWLPMIFMTLFDIVFIILLFKQLQKKRANYISAQEKRQRSSIKWLIATIVISIIMYATTALLYSLTNDEDFFYTPEIVGHYVDQSGDYSEFEMMVQSCDRDGNLVVLHSFNERHKTYNVVYSGKVVKRTLTKVLVELTIVEYEKLPLNFSSSDYVKTIEFDSNFDSINYDYITMTRSNE